MIVTSQIHRHGISYWTADSWLERGVFHGFVGDNLDVSNTGCDWERIFSVECLTHPLQLLLLKQGHATSIVRVDRTTIDQVAHQSKYEPLEGDAWILDSRGVEGKSCCVGIKTADCFPVLIADRKKGIFAAVHCGWRGAVAGLLPDVISEMLQMGVLTRDLEVVIGPGARSCCYEVGPEVVSEIVDSCRAFDVKACDLREGGYEVSDAAILCERSGKSFVEISELLVQQARHLGLLVEQIAVVKKCTICSPGLFSYRRQKNLSGRQVSFIGVLPPVD